jgi:lipopolysaccharide export system permease protein
VDPSPVLREEDGPMKILTRYILKEFMAPFLLAMMSFAIIILVVRVFEDIRFIMDNKPAFIVTAKYFILQVPFLLLQVTPVAVLMAVLFSLGRLSKGSELIAMRAGGVSIFLVTWPLVTAGLLITLLSIAFNETVVPRANQKTERIKYVEIEKKPVPQMTVRHNVSIRGAYNRMYHIGTFDGNAKTMVDILILEFDQGIRLKSRLDAKTAAWQGGGGSSRRDITGCSTRRGWSCRPNRSRTCRWTCPNSLGTSPANRRSPVN